MEYLVLPLLGFIFGVLVIYISKPTLFTGKPMDYSAMEMMFEEFISEIEQKQEAFRQEIAEKEDRIQKLMMEMETMVHANPNQISPKARMVYDLVEQGMGHAEIARKLGIGQGEVQLILNLHPKGNVQKLKADLD